MSDIVEAHKSELSDTALLNSSYYNSVTKRRGYYLVPLSQGAEPFHVWGDLVEQAGFKLSDIPNTWDARWDFFKPMQQVLRAKGRRKIYAMGPQMTTVGPNDGNGLFAALHDRQWRRGHRHARRQAAYRRSAGPGGGDPLGQLSDRLPTSRATCRPKP